MAHNRHGRWNMFCKDKMRERDYLEVIGLDRMLKWIFKKWICLAEDRYS
jgi:hypothetical protein